jgi:SnoaL-like domain
MRKRMVVVAAAVAVVLVVLAVAQARSQSRQGGSLTALDYAEIQQLYGRYAIGYDTGNGEMWAQAFTSDGTFMLPGGKSLAGRKQLAEFAAAPGSNKGPTNVFHVNSNTTIEPTPEGAKGTAYVVLVNIGANGAPSTLTGGGIYRDEFVKTAEGWRIKKRIYQPAHSVPPGKTQ